jgi:D-alanyl-D-alanine carboxypeptidase (penicillin-binding protein 5/6)
MGVDGLKTGYLAVEKYSLASSRIVGERRIIAVASGFNTKNSRSRESAKMLNWAIRTFDVIKVTKKNENFESLNVWLGKKDKVNVYTKEDVYLSVPKRKKSTVKAFIEYYGPIKAPIHKDQKLGVLNIFIEDELTKELDFFASEDIKKSNIFSRLYRSFNYLIWGDV